MSLGLLVILVVVGLFTWAIVSSRGLTRFICVVVLLALVAGFVILFGPNSAGRKTAKIPVPASRLVQPMGEFSFVTPDGWSRTKLAGIDFIIVSGAADRGAEPNIFVEGIEQSGSIENAAKALVKTKKERILTYKVLNKDDLVTESGLNGIKISAVRENDDALTLSLYHYLIGDENRTIVITCLCAETVQEKYEAIFDTAMRSLEFETTDRQTRPKSER